MKKLIICIMAVLMAAGLSGCCLAHDWEEATCEKPKTCAKCGETEGEALGHVWEEATCTKAKACSVCGAEQGSPLGHSWKAATCTEAAACTVCGAAGEAALGHFWQEADCTRAKACRRCGGKEGEPLGHDLAPGGICLRCDSILGQEITLENFAEYFKLSETKPSKSPYTCSVKPKGTGYTFGNKDGKGISVGIRVQIVDDYGRVDHFEWMTIKLDSKGYGSAQITFSDARYGVYNPVYKVFGTYTAYDKSLSVSGYAYKEK